MDCCKRYKKDKDITELNYIEGIEGYILYKSRTIYLLRHIYRYKAGQTKTAHLSAVYYILQLNTFKDT